MERGLKFVRQLGAEASKQEFNQRFTLIRFSKADAAALAAAFEILYRDPDLRQRLGEGARERIATDFRNEDTVRKTVALYEELVPVGVR